MDAAQYGVLLEDLRELRKALGLPHGALPISPRRAFLECVEAVDLFRDACYAAIKYDVAIRRAAARGESWVGGDDLDDLYADWITKAQAAVRDKTWLGG